MLLDIDGRQAPGTPGAPAGEAAPTHTVRGMEALKALLAERYDLQPPAPRRADAAAC